VVGYIRRAVVPTRSTLTWLSNGAIITVESGSPVMLALKFLQGFHQSF